MSGRTARGRGTLMELEAAANGSFVGFDGGIQQLTGEDTAVILPVVLGTICAIGVGGNILVLAVLLYKSKAKSACETAMLLANLSVTDLLLLAPCASMRALTYHRRAWTLGHLACRTTEWLQHGCLAGKAFTLAVMGQTLDSFEFRPVDSAHFNLKRILVTVATIWTLGLAFPVADIIFSKVQVKGNISLCVSVLPPHAVDFMRVYSKVLPLVVYAVPVVFAAVCHIRSIFQAIPRSREASVARQNQISLTFLSVTAANTLLLLPEWGAWVWMRHDGGTSCKPPAALLVLAQVCMYLASALSPAILLTMLVPLRESLSRLCLRVTCRDTLRGPKKQAAAPEGHAIVISDEMGRVSVVTLSEKRTDAFGRTLPDLEHFWTGRRNTEPPDNNDPFPWERLEQGSADL